MNIQHQKKLFSTEMDYWQNTGRRSRMETVRNETISQITEMENKVVDGNGKQGCGSDGTTDIDMVRASQKNRRR